MRAAQEAAPADWRRRTFWLCAGMAALVLAACAPAFKSGFIWDDDAHVTANACIVGPLGLRQIWTTAAADYFPLVLTHFWLQHALWGLNPWPYHAVTIFVHLLCALTLWRVLFRLRVPGAWLGAALWAVHPVQVESVARISELKNTQSCLFYLLSIRFFLAWIEPGQIGPEGKEPAAAGASPLRRETRCYVLAWLLAVLAILNKPSTVMLPAVLGLCWWWRSGRFGWRQLAQLAPFAGVAGVASAWAIWEQRFHSGAIGAEWNQSWPERFAIAGRDIWFYLGKLVWPHPLMFMYPRWTIDPARLTTWLPLLAAVGAGALLWSRRNGSWRPVFLAAAYFGLLLFPVLGFFSVFFYRYSFVGDHFQYLASIGPLALAGAGFATAAGTLPRTVSFLAPAVAGGLLLILGAQTWRQCGVYADNEILWRTTCALNPECWLAQNNLGDILARSGRPAEAIDHYRRALRQAPEPAEIEFNLGDACVQTGRTAEAVAAYLEAVRLRPDYVSAHANLGQALVSLGRLAEAIPQYEQALRLRPDDADTETNLGLALAHTGRVPEALDHEARALRLQPASPVAHNNLGSALASSGQLSAAIDHFREAVRLKPDYADARYNLANALGNAGRLPEAIAEYRELLRQRPTHAEGQANLGLALAGTDQVGEALEHLGEAVRLRPGYAEAHAYLGFALARAGRLPEAVGEYRVSLGLNPNNPDAHYQLGVALRSLGRTAEAEEQFEAASRPAP